MNVSAKIFGSNVVKVKLSSKFQIVIPREIREELDLKPGEQIVIIEKAGIMQLIPQKPIKKTRGFIKGGDTKNIREEKDRV